MLLILLLLVCYINAETTRPSILTTSVSNGLKEDLLKRADELQGRAKAAIVKLQAQNREHLAILLSEEEWRLKMVSNELRNSNPDQIRLVRLETELIHLEYRISKELSILERERLTQEMLLANAKTLKVWVQAQMKILETQNNEHAHQAYLELEGEATGLNHWIEELNKAQDQKTIERIEVILRAVEIRIYETLKHLGFQQKDSTSTPGLQQGTTLYEETNIIGDSTPSSSLITTSKDILMKKVSELQEYMSKQINDSLSKENRTPYVKSLQTFQQNVETIHEKLEKLSQKDMELIESELYWIERCLAIELESLLYNTSKIEKYLSVAVALRERVETAVHLLANKPVAKKLSTQLTKLNIVSQNLKNSSNDKNIENIETDLNEIRKHVSDEIGIIPEKHLI